MNIEHTQHELAFGDGGIHQTNHNEIYNLPQLEENHGLTRGLSVFGSGAIAKLRSEGICVDDAKTTRTVMIKGSDGVNYHGIIRVGREYPYRYSLGISVGGEVNGIDYLSMYDLPARASIMVLNRGQLAGLDRNTLLRERVIASTDLDCIVTFNIESKLPKLIQSFPNPEPLIDQITGRPIYSTQRHPAIWASKFMFWGIEHIRNMPADLQELYGIDCTEPSGILLNWEIGSDNYNAVIGPDGKIAKDTIQSTFSYQQAVKLGFNHIRFIAINSRAGIKAPTSNDPRPDQIVILMAKEKKRGSGYVITDGRITEGMGKIISSIR